MPERGGRLERLRLAAPLRVGGATLVLVERVAVRAERGRSGAWVSAGVEPYALVVRQGGRTTALAVGAAAVSMERLREQIRGIDGLLDGA